MFCKSWFFKGVLLLLIVFLFAWKFWLFYLSSYLVLLAFCCTTFLLPVLSFWFVKFLFAIFLFGVRVFNVTFATTFYFPAALSNVMLFLIKNYKNSALLFSSSLENSTTGKSDDSGKNELFCMNYYLTINSVRKW